MPPFSLEPQPKVITFDCYSTLVQYFEVLGREFEAVLTAQGRDAAQAGAVGDTFAAHSRQLMVERPHRLFRDVLRTGFRSTLTEHGLAAADETVERLALSLNTAGPHAEVSAALRRLRARYRLAIITNSDDALIAHNVALLGVPIDHVITAEQAQAYKPNPQLFEHAYRTMGVTKDETVHVAMGMYADMKATHALGVRAIWVNRSGAQGNPDWKPYEEVSDLDEAAALLLPDE